MAIRSWSDAAAAAVRDAQPPAPDPVASEGWLGALTKPSLKVLGYTFKDPRRGQVVLVHFTSSARRKSTADNQNRSPDPGVRDTAVRYKLLGNALLEYCESSAYQHGSAADRSLVVVKGIWDKYPNAGPPAMTTMKVSIILSNQLIY